MNIKLAKNFREQEKSREIAAHIRRNPRSHRFTRLPRINEPILALSNPTGVNSVYIHMLTFAALRTNSDPFTVRYPECTTANRKSIECM